MVMSLKIIISATKSCYVSQMYYKKEKKIPRFPNESLAKINNTVNNFLFLSFLKTKKNVFFFLFWFVHSEPHTIPHHTE